MNGRTTTNVLLAIIAGVLLFGQSAMTGAVQIGAIAFAAMLVLGLFWAVLLSFVTWFMDELRSAPNNGERLATVALVLIVPLLASLFLTAGWAWLHNEERPIDYAMESAAGTAWTYLLAVGLAGAFAVFTWRFGRRMIEERSQIPARLKNAVLFYLVAVFAVVAFPIREWRSRRAAGLNVFWAGGNAFFVMLVGFGISLGTIGFSLLAGAVLVGAIPLATVMQ